MSTPSSPRWATDLINLSDPKFSGQHAETIGDICVPFKQAREWQPAD
ncbi:hypothetical protein OHR68_36060 [Spirillospora sp. NBC_00431]